MRIQSLRSFVLVTALCTALSPAALLARTFDGPLGLIRRPASTHPVMLLAGETFEIVADAGPNAAGWAAELKVAGTVIPAIALELVEQRYDTRTGRWTLKARVPQGAPQELYDLNLAHQAAVDTSKIAVKVYKEWPTRYRVAHLSDTQDATARPGITDGMEKIIRDLNVLQPDFALNTGDLVNYGRPEEYKDYLREAEKARFPMFNIPGNHDVFFAPCRTEDRDRYQARYENYIGERDYGFSFGRHRWVGVELSGYRRLCPYTDLSPSQVNFVDREFTAHSDASLKVLFGHQWHRQNADELEMSIQRNDIDAYLYGHIHKDAARYVGDKLFAAVGWAGHGRFRIFQISNDRIESFTYRGAPVESIPGGDKFTRLVTYSEKDGGRTATIRIKTTLEDKFPNIPARIEMPPVEEGHYVATGAEIVQVVDAGSKTYVYLSGLTASTNPEPVTVFWDPRPPASPTAPETDEQPATDVDPGEENPDGQAGGGKVAPSSNISEPKSGCAALPAEGFAASLVAAAGWFTLRRRRQHDA